MYSPEAKHGMSLRLLKHNNNNLALFPAPKETKFIPSKPRTFGKPEISQTKPGNYILCTYSVFVGFYQALRQV